LEWARDQDFERVQSRLLPLLERIVVEEHAALHRDVLGEDWSPPAAYRWIRYEDPDPIARLIDATARLESEWEGAATPVPEVFERLEAPMLREAQEAAAEIGFPTTQRPGHRASG
jgi:hypothetical protein